MHTQDRRAYGDGNLFLRPNAKGGQTWIGSWRVNGRTMMRTVGPKQSKAQPHGLTPGQAETEFRKIRDKATISPTRANRRTLTEVGEAFLAAKRSAGRKPSTLESIESILRIHITPWCRSLATTDINKISRDDVRRFDAELMSKRLSPKSRANALGVLHGIFKFAADEEWMTSQNPTKGVAKPVQRRPDDGEIHFLTTEEVEALIRAVPDDVLGRVERVMYLTAAMTGMRQGELLGLRWGDVDWTAGRVRVRRAFVRGEFGSPKSKRSSRSIPLATRVAAELDGLSQASTAHADDDLVFAHPTTGKPIDRSKLLKRFKAELVRAGVREVRFHDLRHTFGTRMAAEGVPMRTLQEWMGHRDFGTTLIYSDYSPSAREAEWVERAFAAPDLAVASAR
jgi:integrase